MLTDIAHTQRRISKARARTGTAQPIAAVHYLSVLQPTLQLCAPGFGVGWRRKTKKRGMCDSPTILRLRASGKTEGVRGSLAIPEVPSCVVLRTDCEILRGVAGEKSRGDVNVSWRGRILAATLAHTIISTLPHEHFILHMT